MDRSMDRPAAHHTGENTPPGIGSGEGWRSVTLPNSEQTIAHEPGYTPEEVAAFNALEARIQEAHQRVEDLSRQVNEATGQQPAAVMENVPQAPAAERILQIHRDLEAGRIGAARNEANFIDRARADIPRANGAAFIQAGEDATAGELRAGRAVDEYAQLRRDRAQAEKALTNPQRDRLRQVEDYIQLRDRLEGGQALTTDEFNRLNDFERAEVTRIAAEVGITAPGSPQNARMAADSLQRMRERARDVIADGRNLRDDTEYNQARRNGFNGNILAALGNDPVQYFDRAQQFQVGAYVDAQNNFDQYITNLQSVAENRMAAPGRLNTNLANNFAAAQDELRTLQDERAQMLAENPALAEIGTGGGGTSDTETQPGRPTTRAEAAQRALDLMDQADEARANGDEAEAARLDRQANRMLAIAMILPEVAATQTLQQTPDQITTRERLEREQRTDRNVRIARIAAMATGVAVGAGAVLTGVAWPTIGLVGAGYFLGELAVNRGLKAIVAGNGKLQKINEQLARQDLTTDERARLEQQRQRVEKTRRTFDHVHKVMTGFGTGFGLGVLATGLGVAAHSFLVSKGILGGGAINLGGGTLGDGGLSDPLAGSKVKAATNVTQISDSITTGTSNIGSGGLNPNVFTGPYGDTAATQWVESMNQQYNLNTQQWSEIFKRAADQGIVNAGVDPSLGIEYWTGGGNNTNAIAQFVNQDFVNVGGMNWTPPQGLNNIVAQVAAGK